MDKRDRTKGDQSSTDGGKRRWQNSDPIGVEIILPILILQMEIQGPEREDWFGNKSR